MEPQIISEKVITRGLVDLGILKGDPDELYEAGAHKDFYMHKVGHWLGLDVHDVGDYMEGDEDEYYDDREWERIPPRLNTAIRFAIFASVIIVIGLWGLGIYISNGDLIVIC